MTTRQKKFWYWVVNRLPRKLVYFCSRKVFTFATTEKYGNTEVPKLTAMDAIGRYNDEYKIE